MDVYLRSILRQLFSRFPAAIQDPVREQVHARRQRLEMRAQTRRNIAAVQEGYRLVPEGALEEKYAEALSYLVQLGTPVKTVGDYFEFGVYNGSSLACAFRAFNKAGACHVRLFGFDSFQGLPPDASKDDGGVWSPGQFSMDESFARHFLTEQGVDWNRVTLAKGWFSETLTERFVRKHSIRTASIIMMDCDTYTSTTTVLPFCAPLIADRAALFFDDWFAAGLADKNLGQKRAFDEFLSQHPEFSTEDIGGYGNYSKVFIVSR